MEFFFQFGYHRPDVWSLMSSDPDFDYESTGILRIDGESEDEARRWGIEVVKWYMGELNAAQNGYVWSERDYAVWTETEEPDDLVLSRPILQVAVGEYPDFEHLHRFLRG